MVKTLPVDDQILLERVQRRRCMRLVVYMTVLTGLTIASQFMSLFGAEVGALPWWAVLISLPVLGWAMVMLRRVNDKLERLERQQAGLDMADGHDVPT